MLELTPHEKWLAGDTSAGGSTKSAAAQHHARVRMAKIQSREALYKRPLIDHRKELKAHLSRFGKRLAEDKSVSIAERGKFLLKSV